jgi:two-component system phosphate regulon sensor histidine kinase PhoR
MPLTQVDAVVGRLHSLLLVAGAVGLALAVLLSALASHLLTRTLRTLVRNARALALGERTLPLAMASSDEIGGLAGSLQTLSDTLENTVAVLAEERDRLQTILDGMREAVLAIDRDQRITLMNQAACDLLGLSSRPEDRLLLEVIRVPAVEQLLAQAERGQPATAELELPGIPSRCLLGHVASLKTTQEHVLVMHDVTDMRRLETVRRDFVANVSHELRTPVSVIRANAETLLGDALDDREQARTFVGAIHRNAERLSNIITDLLDLSRIESGEFVVEPAAVLLEPVVRRVIDAVELEARRKQLSVTSQIETSLVVQADEKLLEQILSNLLDNAVKYTQPEGHIFASTTLDGDEVRIEICDDGPGIELKHRDRIFERFYRVDPGRSRELGGTGLGLSIVKHFVMAMGGDVGMSPRSPRGSVFWFTLPRGSS